MKPIYAIIRIDRQKGGTPLAKASREKWLKRTELRWEVAAIEFPDEDNYLQHLLDQEKK